MHEPDPRCGHERFEGEMAALLRELYADGEPEWAAWLARCAVDGICPSRLELLSVVDTLRAALTQRLDG